MLKGALIAPLDLLAQSLDCDATAIGADAALGTLANWDSLGHLQVMMALEKHYGVEITDETIRKYENLAAIERRYSELIGSVGGGLIG